MMYHREGMRWWNRYYIKITEARGIWTRVLSSAGRASPLQGESRRFDPVSTHHSPKEIPQKIQFKV